MLRWSTLSSPAAERGCGEILDKLLTLGTAYANQKITPHHPAVVRWL